MVVRRFIADQAEGGSLFAPQVISGRPEGISLSNPRPHGSDMTAIAIRLNTISDHGQRAAVEQAVRDTLRPRAGAWTVWLGETPDPDHGWTITIQGPGGATRTWTFAADAQEPSIVRATLERDLGETMMPMGWQTTSEGSL
jgi:hypothetical protein